MSNSATEIANLLYRYAELMVHVIANPIIEVDETAGTATCRSYYTVLQATDSLPLQVIAAGRYHDNFERADGKWRFSYRDYTLFDLAGDLSDHLLIAVAG